MVKNKSKVLVGLLMVAMSLSLFACGNKKQTAENSVPQSTETRPSGTEMSSASKIKITLCVGNKNDMSFQQSAYEGIERVGKELGDKFEVNTVEMGDDATKWLSAFYDACDAGANIIVGTGFQNKETFEQLAVEYPDIKFILFDQDVDYTKGDLSNVLSALFESSQSGYLAGMTAAMYTLSDNAANKDKTIGFVGGMDSSTINNFLIGYAEGAHAVDPDIKILTSYVGDYVDTAKAKDLTNAQISQGADIIFQVAGGAGNGVIEAASEAKGVMAIGVDSDQYQTVQDAKLKAVIITSALKRLDNVLFKICSDYAQDPSSVEFGKVYTYGLNDDAVGIVFNDNLTNSIGADNVTKLQGTIEKIKSGEIKVDNAANMSTDQIKGMLNN